MTVDFGGEKLTFKAKQKQRLNAGFGGKTAAGQIQKQIQAGAKAGKKPGQDRSGQKPVQQDFGRKKSI